jgi:hypothetical protein
MMLRRLKVLISLDRRYCNFTMLCHTSQSIFILSVEEFRCSASMVTRHHVLGHKRDIVYITRFLSFLSLIFSVVNNTILSPPELPHYLLLLSTNLS